MYSLRLVFNLVFNLVYILLFIGTFLLIFLFKPWVSYVNKLNNIEKTPLVYEIDNLQNLNFQSYLKNSQETIYVLAANMLDNSFVIFNDGSNLNKKNVITLPPSSLLYASQNLKVGQQLKFTLYNKTDSNLQFKINLDTFDDWVGDISSDTIDIIEKDNVKFYQITILNSSLAHLKKI
jgi:hypothetical protein